MISARTKTLLYRIFAFFIVMLVGAFVFLATEGRFESSESEDSEFRTMFNISVEDYELLVEAVRNDTSSPSILKIPWTYGNSFYFVIVLITTIGYGHLCPETWQGQVFCIFFSLIGIPVTAIMLKSIGEFIAKAITFSLCAFEKRVLKREPKNLQQKCFIASVVLMFLMLLGGALFTYASEGWSMTEGIYFTFVTLSTIGFGDYVVNDGVYMHKDLTRTVVTQFNLVFLLLGLGVVSSVLCSIRQLLEAGGLGCCKRREEINDSGKARVPEMESR